MSKILNFGSLNIDYVYSVPHFVMPGETLAAIERNVFAGGKGLNQSVAAARAGGNVYHAGAVGKDDSKVLTDTIAANKINDKFLMRRDSPSGHTFIQVDAKGQNCILLYGGANQSITCDEIDAALSFFDKGDYLILQNEINNIEYIIKHAAAKGIKVCFNVSPFTLDLLNLPLEDCAYLIVNEIEGSSMVNMPEDTDPYLLIEKLAAKYPKTSFVLTLGSRGSLLKLQNQEVISCKSFKVKAVDTTAAGDTFLGYLIANLAANVEPALALKTATAASAIAVTIVFFCYTPPSDLDIKWAWLFPTKYFEGLNMLDYSCASPFTQGQISPGDFFPFIPYAAFFFAGMALAPLLYKNKRSLIPSLNGRWNRAICAIGKFTLVIYILHIAALVLLFEIITLIATGQTVIFNFI